MSHIELSHAFTCDIFEIDFGKNDKQLLLLEKFLCTIQK